MSDFSVKETLKRFKGMRERVVRLMSLLQAESQRSNISLEEFVVNLQFVHEVLFVEYEKLKDKDKPAVTENGGVLDNWLRYFEIVVQKNTQSFERFERYFQGNAHRLRKPLDRINAQLFKETKAVFDGMWQSYTGMKDKDAVKGKEGLVKCWGYVTRRIVDPDSRAWWERHFAQVRAPKDRRWHFFCCSYIPFLSFFFLRVCVYGRVLQQFFVEWERFIMMLASVYPIEHDTQLQLQYVLGKEPNSFYLFLFGRLDACRHSSKC
jgi:hypothetical protein